MDKYKDRVKARALVLTRGVLLNSYNYCAKRTSTLGFRCSQEQAEGHKLEILVM